MKKLLLTALLLSLALTGVATTNGEGTDENYDVMPTNVCHPVDCWG